VKAEKKKVVVIQPFGSTAQHSELGIYDKSMRSFNHVFANKLVEKLSKDYLVINMNAPLLISCGTQCSTGAFPNWDNIASLQPDPDLRTWAAIIQEADYFIGCDSCGQHIARSVCTDASVVVAGTHEVNISYPEKFHIIKKKDAKYYPNPMRVSMMNSTLADKLNQNRATFTEEEMDSAIKEIIKRIENGKRVTESITVDVEQKKENKGFSK